MEHVMTIKAYPRKLDFGGGYRAVVRVRTTGAEYESDVLASDQEAIHWAQSKAHEIMGARPYRRASIYRRHTGGNYVANIWA